MENLCINQISAEGIKVTDSAALSLNQGCNSRLPPPPPSLPTQTEPTYTPPSPPTQQPSPPTQTESTYTPPNNTSSGNTSGSEKGYSQAYLPPIQKDVQLPEQNSNTIVIAGSILSVIIIAFLVWFFAFRTSGTDNSESSDDEE